MPLSFRSDASGNGYIQTGGTDQLKVDNSGVFSVTPGGIEKARVAADGSQSSVIPGGSTLYPEFKCRAWVNFNGTGTVAIRGSGNVSSITDNGTGDYTVNFATAMPDTNYNFSGFARGDGTGIAVIYSLNATSDASKTTSGFRVNARYYYSVSFGNYDSPEVNISVFR